MTAFNLTDARIALFKNEHPEGVFQVALPVLEGTTDLPLAVSRPLQDLLGLAALKQLHYDDASRWFFTSGDFYQAGYSQMLKGDLPQAIQFWRHSAQLRQNHWCVCLYGLVTKTLDAVPTYLQVRNHLEADLVQLIRAGQIGYVENLLQYLDFLGEVNYEAYKYAGRALFQAGWTERAGGYLMRGQRSLPNDPEVYYQLGQFYAATGQRNEALVVLNQCLLISPSYVPAKELYNSVKQDHPIAP